jgi:hypothetical protein
MRSSRFHCKGGAHGALDYIPMHGGAQATREPWLMAAVYLHHAPGDDFLKLEIPFVRNLDGRDACIIGEVKAESEGIVAMRAGFGGTRIVCMLVGEQLPRIC